MKLIGAGLPRTATLSQKIALEMLGMGPCYHMVDVLGDLDRAAQWRQALDGAARWDEIFDGYESTVDWPGAYFYEELMKTYPDAKVLLSARDADAWENSMRETIWGIFYGDCLMKDLSNARSRVDQRWFDYIDMMKEMWQRSGLLDAAGGADGGAMQRYNEEVQERVPSGRLLVWTADDGWEPLCQFLEVDVPDAPFPRVNDQKGFIDRVVGASIDVLQSWWAEQEPAMA
jgi:Sulfotransferase domain